MDNYKLNIAVLLLAVVTTASVFSAFLVIYRHSPSASVNHTCNDPCRFSLIETIPENLTYNGTSLNHPSIYESWMELISAANESIDIGAFYFTLQGKDVMENPDPSAINGDTVFNGLKDALTKRKLKVRIVQSKPTGVSQGNDTAVLGQLGADVRSIDFPKLVGAGILHTKLWVIDNKHFYVGSANLDWRSLAQVKELGTVTYDCPCLAADIAKIFEAYWAMSAPDAEIPSPWPDNYDTIYNNRTPAEVKLNGKDQAMVYLSSSPPQFCPASRTTDIDAILDIINKPQKFIYIAVMDYFPTTLYLHPNRAWFVIDNALRIAAYERNVEVRVLGSWWNHTQHSMPYFLESLKLYSRHIQVKLFKVPASVKQAKIPYSRVNHNKYMVTENVAYIGTSNWSGDYFIDTGGIGFIVNQTSNSANSSIPQQLKAIFDRDWNSSYSHPVTDHMKI
ncbi:phospholipase D3 [Lingula anatina]|uniref:Phospholipase D3 n=1 Tax=Lingula anatina TaxID=7574 RepID=A0A1S3IB16_LINAN|nr:phospholipase D3 [Lingula anatina]|eukprot:XP_013395460.1 phospholipase D3 [Lingula anatina]